MKKHLFILMLLALSLSATYAQDVKKPQPDSLIKIIPYGEGRYSGYLYTIGGKLQTREDVQIRLMAYAPSAVEFKAARRNVAWSFAFLGATAFASTGALIEFHNNSKPPVATAAFVNGEPGFTYTYPNNNKTGAYILTAAAIGFIAAEVTTWVNAAVHTKKALSLYNKQYE
jgi:hypothetical protein